MLFQILAAGFDLAGDNVRRIDRPAIGRTNLAVSRTISAVVEAGYFKRNTGTDSFYCTQARAHFRICDPSNASMAGSVQRNESPSEDVVPVCRGLVDLWNLRRQR